MQISLKPAPPTPAHGTGDSPASRRPERVPAPVEPAQLRYGWAWQTALACFVLAALTGAFFRFGAYTGFGGLQPINVRHAHSHLMFFGWVTPALMALIAARLPGLTGRAVPPLMGRSIAATLVLGVLAYPPFLLYGYGVATIGGARIPLSVIGAALNVLGWYAFGIAYVRATWRVERTLPLRLWDAALAMIVLSSMGAWALGLVRGAGVIEPFPAAAALHLFLGLFSEGWFVLALLGIAYAALPVPEDRRVRLATDLVVYGLPFTFLLGVPVELVPPNLRLISGLAGVVVAVGLLLHVAALRQSALASRAGWAVPLLFLALKAVAQFGVAVAPVALWAEQTGLRVSYLHWLLLGFVSLGLVAAAGQTWGRSVVQGQTLFVAGAVLMIASLLPLTGAWPAVLAGGWAWPVATAATFGPIGAALYMLARAQSSRAGRLASRRSAP